MFGGWFELIFFFLFLLPWISTPCAYVSCNCPKSLWWVVVWKPILVFSFGPKAKPNNFHVLIGGSWRVYIVHRKNWNLKNQNRLLNLKYKMFILKLYFSFAYCYIIIIQTSKYTQNFNCTQKFWNIHITINRMNKHILL